MKTLRSLLGGCLLALALGTMTAAQDPPAPTPLPDLPVPAADPGPVAPPAPPTSESPPAPAPQPVAPPPMPAPPQIAPQTTPATVPAPQPQVTPPMVPAPQPQATLPTVPVSQPQATPPTVPAPQPMLPVEVSRPALAIQIAAPVPIASPVEERPAPPSEAIPPTGRQSPAVSLEWHGPLTVRVGQPNDYTLLVRNTGTAAVTGVTVRVRLPEGLRPQGADPQPSANEGGLWRWDVGTLQARQDRSLALRLVPAGNGEVDCQAWVTFTGAAALRIRACEPKLVVRAAFPERVQLGDAVTAMLTVQNTGDAPAEQVRVRVTVSEGLEHARGRQIELDVGTLTAGDSRSLPLSCVARAGGEQRCELVAEGEGGLQARAQTAVVVQQARLVVEATGPRVRYLERKAIYSFKVANAGDATAGNTQVATVLPTGLRFLQALDGGRYDPATRQATWFLGDLPPGQTREVKAEVVAVEVGDHRQQIVVQAARGARADGELLTRIEAVSALLLEVVDVEDPVEVGGEVTYEIRITNIGSRTETDVRLQCQLPEQLQLQQANGATTGRMERQIVQFEPIAQLPPRSAVKYRLVARGLSPGQMRVTCQVTSATLPEPVVETQTTRIYAD